MIKLRKKLVKILWNKNPGNIESFITILPQVAIFLMSIQLVFMQFTQSKDAYLLHGKGASSFAHSAENFGFQEESLIGGGKIKVYSSVKSQPIFLSNLLNLKSKTNTIELDESSIS